MPLNFPNSPSTNDTYTFAGKSWTYNGNAWVLTSTTLTTSNVSEGANLYYTEARVAPIFDQANTATTIGQSAFDQANTATTNASSAFDEANSRVQTVGGVTDTVVTNAQIVAAITDSSPEFQDVVVQGNLTVTGNVTYLNVEALEVDDNMIYLNANSTVANPDLGWAGNYNDGTYRHAGVFRDATDGVFKFFDEYEPEPDASAFIDTANTTFHLANVQATTFIGNVTGVVSSIANFDTGDLTEGTNLYYTEARVAPIFNQANTATTYATSAFDQANTATTYATSAFDQANINSTSATSAFLQANLAYDQANTATTYATSAFDAANTKTVAADLTTANVTEVTNLYFTNARSILAGIPSVTQLVVTTPVFNYNIDQYSGDNPGIYVTAGETISFELNQSSAHPFALRESSGGSNVTVGLTHVDANGTISTGASAQGKVGGKLFWKVPYELAGNTYVYQCVVHSGMVGDIVIQKQQSTLLTTDIPEGSNLYYTDARVYSNVSSIGYALTSDLTTANVTELTNLYFTNTRAVSALTAGNNIGIDANGLITANVVGGGGGAVSSVNGEVGSVTLVTANINEDTNLYFTNTRAVSALTSGENIEIASNGLITGTVTGGGGGGSGNITVTYNTTPPASGNTIGDLWVDSTTGAQYFYVADEDSAQWVELGTVGLQGPSGPEGSGGGANPAQLYTYNLLFGGS